MPVRFLKALNVAALAAIVTGQTGCPSSSGTQCTNNDGGLSAVGGAVLGPVDNHCYSGGPLAVQVTNMPACYSDAGFYPDAGPPAASLRCDFSADGGPGGCTPGCDYTDGGPDGCAPDYGATMFNSSGNDDDCKYQTGWTSTPIIRNGNTTFYFTAIRTVDGTAATGANVYIEAFLPSANQIADSTHSQTVEMPAGSGAYTIGPIVFSQAGQWTVRFHLNGDCVDELPDSPHGHAAYYISVP